MRATPGSPGNRENLAARLCVLKSLDKLEGVNEDQTVGIRLLARSIEEPQRQIVENAGEDAAVVLNAVKAGTSGHRRAEATEDGRRAGATCDATPRGDELGAAAQAGLWY
jgi:chaperonin GroEL (HSP60 family)